MVPKTFLSNSPSLVNSRCSTCYKPLKVGINQSKVVCKKCRRHPSHRVWNPLTLRKERRS